MNGICNDDYFPDVLQISGLIYATSYSKQFSFCRSDINHLVDYFDDLFVMDMDMSNGGDNMILDAGIRHHKCN